MFHDHTATPPLSRAGALILCLGVGLFFFWATIEFAEYAATQAPV